MRTLEPRNVALAVSARDAAGLNIREALLGTLPFGKRKESFSGHAIYEAAINGKTVRLYTLQEDSIHAEHLDRRLADAGFRPDLVIFLTKHQGGEGIRSLSCHSPGNWHAAEMGGSPKRLCIAPAAMLKAATLALKAEADRMGWLLSVEVTHHGPLMDAPVMFMEIGSTAAEWPLPEAGKAVASAVVAMLSAPYVERRAVLLLGGGHYSHYAGKVQLSSEHALGHACPKFMLPHLDAGMVRQALERTLSSGKPVVLLDWKGLGSEKVRIREMLDAEGIAWERTDRFFTE